MTVHLTKRWGETIEDPDANELTAALRELSTDDPEHPDCWLSDDNDWTISAFPSGLVVLQNAETREGLWHMRGRSHSEILDLWNLLTLGSLDELRRLPWVDGYS